MNFDIRLAINLVLSHLFDESHILIKLWNLVRLKWWNLKVIIIKWTYVLHDYYLIIIRCDRTCVSLFLSFGTKGFLRDLSSIIRLTQQAYLRSLRQGVCELKHNFIATKKRQSPRRIIKSKNGFTNCVKFFFFYKIVNIFLMFA